MVGAAIVPRASSSRWDAIQPWTPEGVISLINVILLGTLGVFGNIMIISSILFDKHMRKHKNFLVLNLGLADLSISLLFPFNVIGITSGPDFFRDRAGTCAFLSAVCHISCICAGASLTFISIDRALRICRPKWHEKVFGVKRTVVYMGLSWLAGIIVDLPANVGGVDRHFDLKMAICVWDRINGYTYTLGFAATVVLFVCITVTNYVCIFVYVHRKKKALQKAVGYHQPQNGGGETRVCADQGKTGTSGQAGATGVVIAISRGPGQSDSVKLARTLFITSLVFTLCFVPLALVLLFDRGNQLPAGVYSITLQLMHDGSAASFLIYGLYNVQYRKGFGRTLRWLMCGRLPNFVGSVDTRTRAEGDTRTDTAPQSRDTPMAPKRTERVLHL